MSVKKHTIVENYQWRIVVLLFFATTINYIDPQVRGILSQQFQQQFGWSESYDGFIIRAFQTVYVIGLISIGSLFGRRPRLF